MGVVKRPSRPLPHLLVAATDSPLRARSRADYICDGTADDVQIQAAIDAITSSGELLGGTVELTEGTFTIATTINLNKQGVKLIGQGEEATYLVRATGGSVLKIGDGTTAGNGKNQYVGYMKFSAGTGYTAIEIDKVQRLAIEHIVIRFGTTGIKMEDWQWISFKNIAMRNIKGVGLDLISNTGSEGHFSIDDMNVEMNSTALANGSAGIRITRTAPGNPIYETVFRRVHIISSDADATGFICLDLSDADQTVRNMQLDSCTFEILAGGTNDAKGVTSGAANTMLFNACAWFGGSAMAVGFENTANNGSYTFMHGDMRTFKATTGIGFDPGSSTTSIVLHNFTFTDVADVVDTSAGDVLALSTAAAGL